MVPYVCQNLCLHQQVHKTADIKHKTLSSTFSAINPMLYSLMSTKFRRAFHRILSCRLGRGRGAYYDPRETTCATPSVAHHAATRQVELEGERNRFRNLKDMELLCLHASPNYPAKTSKNRQRYQWSLEIQSFLCLQLFLWNHAYSNQLKSET